MLKFEETTNPHAIEKHICEKINDAEKMPMDIETTKLLIQLVSLKQKNQKDIIPQDKKPFLYQMIEQRMQLFPMKIDEYVLLFLTFFCESPGNAIMYLWFLQSQAFVHKIKEIDFNLFCNEIFPYGFPSRQTLEKIWREQKLERELSNSDNLVDYVTAGKSILNLD